MANEINGIPGPGLHDTHNTRKTDNRPDPGVKNDTSEPGKQAATDSVELTENARLLHKLADRIDELPAVDNDKINAIKEAIANGEYKVDSKQVAKKLAQLDSLLP